MYCGSPLGLFSPGSSFTKYSVVMMVPVMTVEALVHVPFAFAVHGQAPDGSRQVRCVPGLGNERERRRLDLLSLNAAAGTSRGGRKHCWGRVCGTPKRPSQGTSMVWPGASVTVEGAVASQRAGYGAGLHQGLTRRVAAVEARQHVARAVFDLKQTLHLARRVLRTQVERGRRRILDVHR